MKKIFIVIVFMFFISAVLSGGKKKIKFEPTIESLHQFEVPEWFRDAKFGIFLHWGPYAVHA